MRQVRHGVVMAALAAVVVWLGVTALPAGAQTGEAASPLRYPAEFSTDHRLTATGTPSPGDDDGEEADVDDPEGILDLDIEQLARTDVVVPSMDVEVTSVTRTEGTVGQSPTAIFVITPEMIRRSGATCIPEVLRMVPGLEVARINSDVWAISSRGFNDRFANKLLVQIDGRSIYTPIFSGVFWEANHVMLQDVERIEVIRGPGATVWGANAVNGVINIVTKSAEDTQGLLFSGIAGTEERGQTNFRYGGTTRCGVNWRVYGTQFDRDRGTLPGQQAFDDWRAKQAGFRMDWQPTQCDSVTVQGDLFDTDAGYSSEYQFTTEPYTRRIIEDVRFRGGNLLTRWARDLGEDRGWTAQLYYDRFEHRFFPLRENTDTIDVDFQYEFPLGPRHKFVCGCEYRYRKIRTDGSFSDSFDPSDRDLDLFSYFVQDQVTLSPDRLFLTVGSKFEHNEFTGFEFQPTCRLLWAPDKRRAAWAAISRAVRTPSLRDDSLIYPFANFLVGPPPPLYLRFVGNSALQSEEMMAYEMGYRAQPTDRFFWDLSVFFNKYENLQLWVPTSPFPVPPYWDFMAENAMDGESYGFELSATREITPCWRVTGNYSYLQMQLHTDVPGGEAAEGTSPNHQVYLRSSWDLACHLEFDMTLRYVDSLQSAGLAGPLVVPSYTAMDLRLGWRPSECFEAAVVGQNLLDSHHFESFGADTPATEVDRGVYATVTWRH